MRAVRNFFLVARIDGRNTPVRGGPRGKDGGLLLTLYQRDEGRVREALNIICTACQDGSLRLRVEPALQSTIMEDGSVWIDTTR
jgi:hypothetical protein